MFCLHWIVLNIKNILNCRPHSPWQPQNINNILLIEMEDKNVTKMKIEGEIRKEEIEQASGNAIKKSNKCFIDQCLDRVAKIVGDCRYCSHAYCGKHRLPESHACEKLSNCRQESYERNSDKLLNGKCVADKL